MRKVFYLLTFVALCVSFDACNNTDTVNEAWRSANIFAYDSIAKLPEYHALQTSTGPSGVYYKIIQSGTGTVYPLQTSSVYALYQGAFYDEKTLFDVGSSLNNVPTEIDLNGNMYANGVSATITRGLSFVLQNMVVGDKWEIWIPYYLGYGSGGLMSTSGQIVMQGYTTLVFTVELVSITEFPNN